MVLCPRMMKIARHILTACAACTLAWGVDEVKTYAEGVERVTDDGWVLLCHSADWDSTHDEQWLRRQTSISTACGNAVILYVPIYQNPTPEQAEELRQMLNGCPFDFRSLHSVPCAIMLDASGRPYATISGDDFMERAAGLIRQARAQLRTRRDLLRQAAQQEGSAKAQTLSSIWRLSITPPPNLSQRMQEADPEDKAGIAEWSPFDPWALAERIHALPWEKAIAELDRVQAAQLSKEEQQAVLAIRMGCVHRHKGAAGTKELRDLADACSDLAPTTPLAKAAQRAAKIWGRPLSLLNGWVSGQLPAIATSCEVSSPRSTFQKGEYRICIIPTQGQDPVRVTRVTLYDAQTRISEDAHTCCLKPGEPLTDNEYMLIVREHPTYPRLVISFDQQGKTDAAGRFTIRYFTPDGIEAPVDQQLSSIAEAAAKEALKQVSDRSTQDGLQEENTTTPAHPIPAPSGH